MKYGVIQLSSEISSSREVFGQSFDSTISGVPCKVHTPRISAASTPPGSEQLVAPRDDLWLDVTWWGVIGPNMPGLLGCLGISISDDVSFGRMTAVTNEVARWEQCLFTWLSALVGKPTEMIMTRSATVSWSDFGEDVLPGWSQPAKPHRLNSPGIASTDQWSKALAHASDGSEAPLSRVLLVEAFRSLESARWRSAVLDSATATEVALTRAIYDSLTKTSSHEETMKQMDKVRMLGRLITFAKSIGLTIPDAINDDLVSIRNQAMHRGTTVSQHQALAAWLAARTVVEAYEPAL